MLDTLIKVLFPKMLDAYAIYDKRDADKERARYEELLKNLDDAENARSPHYSMDQIIKAEEALERFSLAFGDKYDKALKYLQERESRE